MLTMPELQLHLLSEQVQNNQNLRTIIESYTILSIGSYWVTWTFLDLVSAIAGFAQRSTKPFFLGEYGADASASEAIMWVLGWGR